jgi:hypothetical protein
MQALKDDGGLKNINPMTDHEALELVLDHARKIFPRINTLYLNTKGTAEELTLQRVVCHRGGARRIRRKCDSRLDGKRPFVTLERIGAFNTNPRAVGLMTCASHRIKAKSLYIRVAASPVIGSHTQSLDFSP